MKEKERRFRSFVQTNWWTAFNQCNEKHGTADRMSSTAHDAPRSLSGSSMPRANYSTNKGGRGVEEGQIPVSRLLK